MSAEKRLKPGRRTWRFDEIATNVNERVDDPSEAGVDYYVGLEHLDSDSLIIRRWGSPSDVQATKLRFSKGDIIFGRRRVYQRKLGVAHFDGICSAHAMVLRANPDVALPEFLPFFMQSDFFMERAKEISVGSLSPTINWSALAREEFTLPPRERQSAAANSLLAIDAAMNSLVRLSVAGIQAERALLEELFDPVLALEARANRAHRSSSTWITLGDVAELQAGYAFPSAEFTAAGDRLLRGSNVGVDRIHWPKADTRYWPTNRRSEVARFVLNPGDIVIAMDRPFIADGFKAAQIQRSDLPALLLQRVGRFQAPDETTRALVWAFVHSRSFQLQLMAQQEGTDLPHISKSQIDSTLLPKAALSSPDRWKAYGTLHNRRAATGRRLQELKLIRACILEETLG